MYRAVTETLPEPRAGDAWVLRHILHDWNDEDAARILAALRAAISAAPVTLCLVEVGAYVFLMYGPAVPQCARSQSTLNVREVPVHQPHCSFDLGTS